MATYPNTISASDPIEVGKEFFFHADPRQPALKPRDEVNVHFDALDDPYGRAIVTEEVGPNTYRARRIE